MRTIERWIVHTNRRAGPVELSVSISVFPTYKLHVDSNTL